MRQKTKNHVINRRKSVADRLTTCALTACILALQVPLISHAEAKAPTFEAGEADMGAVLTALESVSCYINVSPYMGSGFIIDSGELYLYVATNRHVAERNQDDAYVKFTGDVWVAAELIYKGTDNDAAFYRVSKAEIPDSVLEQLYVANLRDLTEPLQEGEPIGIAGRDTDTSYYPVSGEVIDISYYCYFSGEGTVEGNLSDYDGKGGTSGSAVIDEQGYVVGIHKGVTSSGYAFFLSEDIVVEEYTKATKQYKEIATLIERS